MRKEKMPKPNAKKVFQVPQSGGSYIRNPDGSLTQSEPATEVALPETGEPVAEAAADQPEQE
jgi:hypothetical protein